MVMIWTKEELVKFYKVRARVWSGLTHFLLAGNDMAWRGYALYSVPSSSTVSSRKVVSSDNDEHRPVPMLRVCDFGADIQVF